MEHINLPSWYWYLLASVWGAAWGSFANVLIHRLPKGMSIITPPSHCPYCKNKLKWWHNIPLLSYIFLRGKCYFCKHPISPRYFFIETITVLLAVLSMYRGLQIKECPFLLLSLSDFFFMYLLLILSVIDFETFILPDKLVLPGVILGITFKSLLNSLCYNASYITAIKEPLLGASVGFGILASISMLYKALRKREGMGLGDAKLLGFIGGYLGPISLILIILLSSLQGILFTFLLHILKIPLPSPKPYKGITTTQELKEIFGEEDNIRFRPIPFGPFLALAGIESLLWGETIIDIIVQIKLYG